MNCVSRNCAVMCFNPSSYPAMIVTLYLAAEDKPLNVAVHDFEWFHTSILLKSMLLSLY